MQVAHKPFWTYILLSFTNFHSCFHNRQQKQYRVVQVYGYKIIPGQLEYVTFLLTNNKFSQAVSISKLLTFLFNQPSYITIVLTIMIIIIMRAR
jgi:hypothetical protein